MTLTKKTTHIADAQKNLISLFRRRKDFDAWIGSLVQELVDLEAAAFDVLNGTLTAGSTTGANQDVMGRLVGVEREGRSDADYDLRIAAQILLNISSGTIEQLLAIVVAMIGTIPTPVVTEGFPAGFDITVDDVAIPNAGEVGSLVVLGKPAGVAGSFRAFSETPEFRFGVVGQGFGLGKLGTAVAA